MLLWGIIDNKIQFLKIEGASDLLPRQTQGGHSTGCYLCETYLTYAVPVRRLSITNRPQLKFAIKRRQHVSNTEALQVCRTFHSATKYLLIDIQLICRRSDEPRTPFTRFILHRVRLVYGILSSPKMAWLKFGMSVRPSERPI